MNEQIIRVDVARCTGCGVCVEVCPTGAVRLVEGGTGCYAEVDEEKCQECGVCVEACPEEAIISQVGPTIEGEVVLVKAKPVPVKSQYRELKWICDYFKPTKFDNYDDYNMLWTTNIQLFHKKNSKLQSLKAT